MPILDPKEPATLNLTFAPVRGPDVIDQGYAPHRQPPALASGFMLRSPRLL